VTDAVIAEVCACYRAAGTPKAVLQLAPSVLPAESADIAARQGIAAGAKWVKVVAKWVKVVRHQPIGAVPAGARRDQPGNHRAEPALRGPRAHGVAAAGRSGGRAAAGAQAGPPTHAAGRRRGLRLTLGVDGTLELTVDDRTHVLDAGDCLRFRLWGASRFRSPAGYPIRYALVVVLP
jgi:hypothetical protein